MTGSDIREILNYVTQDTFLYGVGAVLILVVFLVLLLKRQPKNVVAYKTEDGSVLVSRAAIVELVQTSCEQLEDVSKPNVKIKVKGQVTHFQVRLKLLTGGRMRDVQKTLQVHLRNTLTENLGIENLGKIDIIATGFKSGRINPPARNEEPLADTDEFATEDIETETPEELDNLDTEKRLS
ncbi:MAG: alkaline shock response membrane anchor protein AmaP [Verrucomicrobiota bacterium]